MKFRSPGARWAVLLLALAAVSVVAAVTATAQPAKKQASYVIGVSNTLVGNGWREEMICSVKAQALASGKVSSVKVANRNGGPAEQNADLRNLISAGANAIVVNPSSPSALNAVIAQAASRGVKVVKQTFTGWQFATGGKQILDILNSGVKVDGVWTSGIDYTIVNAFRTAHKKLVPVVGADNNQFLKQLMTIKGFRGAAVTNPATIGGVGTAMAIKLLSGQSVPKWVKLTPQVWDNKTAFGKKQIKANYSSSRPPTYSARLQVKPWTTYSTKQLFSCKGP